MNTAIGIIPIVPNNKIHFTKQIGNSPIGIKHHVTLANGTGIIDADYFSNPDNDGNIGICLQNNSDEIVSFKKGERIMQGVFVKYAVCDSDDTNEVRKGGFGSTGKE